MKVTKGGVTLVIPPSDKSKYLSAGWTLKQDPSKEQIKRINDLRLGKIKREGK